MNSIWLALFAGLTTGGVSCLAVQGGLLTSAIPEDKNLKNKDKNKYVAMFIVSKIIAYTILGFVLGLLGSVLALSLKSYALIQVLIGIFLIGTAGRLMNLHPIFRYFAITPPKFVYRLARNQSKKAIFFTPALLGALTVLMPCGVTQAMMIVAIGAGNPITSAAIMFAFTLGTSPVFFALGIAAVELLKKKAFAYVAGTIVFAFGVISLNSASAILGSPHTLQNYWKAIRGDVNPSVSADVTRQGVQEITINVRNNGYDSNANTLRVGVPVKLKVVTNNIYSCARAFTIPSFGISKILPQTGEEIIEFTPTKTGRLAYSCSMGMYTGSFQVVP